MYEAIQMHIEGMQVKPALFEKVVGNVELREDGLPIPESTAFAEYVVVGAS